MPRFRDLAPAARLYVSLITVLGLVFVPFVWSLHPLTRQHLPDLVYLGIGLQIGALIPVTARGRHWVIPPLLVAVGLLAPGSGIAIVTWLCLFDGRIPGRGASWWALLFNRSMTALTYGLPSLALPGMHFAPELDLPIKTAFLSISAVLINYALMASSVVLVNRVSFARALSENNRLANVRSMLLLCLGGGVLYAVLHVPGGYFLAPIFLGLLFAVRSNITYGEQQAQERLQTLQLAAQALDARDKYTESHSQRVSELAVKIGEKLDLRRRDLERLRSAASLHDIGKIGIRDHILNKASSLTASEWEVMKRHPDIGADMIAQHSALALMAPAVRHHHERWDGSGYPDGLRGEQIPLGARIIAVADGYDTITSARSYRQSALNIEDAIANITALAGKWYDPHVVDALRRVYDYAPIEPTPVPYSVPLHPVGAVRLVRTHPRFAVLLGASTASSIGDPLTLVAIMVSIYSATHQPIAVAASYALQAVATILMSAALGGLTDRVDRRKLLFILEIARAAILVVTPLVLLTFTIWFIFPLVFGLAAINGLVQPARQAAIPELVDHGQVGAANAVVTGFATLAGAVGYPLAALLLLLTASTKWLFWIDASTFIVAGCLATALGDVGGRGAKVRVSGAVRRAWWFKPARPYLFLTAAGVFFISMSFPTQVVLAYHLWHAHGDVSYTVLQTALALGVVAGSFAIGRTTDIGSLRTAALGLLIMGIFSLGLAVAPILAIAAVLMFLASFGNPVYAVANQTALLELGDASNRGSLMASRFALGQAFLVLGAGVGGVMSGMFGSVATFAVIGVGLTTLAGVTTVMRRSIQPRAGRASAPPAVPTESQTSAAGSAAS